MRHGLYMMMLIGCLSLTGCGGGGGGSDDDVIDTLLSLLDFGDDQLLAPLGTEIVEDDEPQNGGEENGGEEGGPGAERSWTVHEGYTGRRSNDRAFGR